MKMQLIIWQKYDARFCTRAEIKAVFSSAEYINVNEGDRERERERREPTKKKHRRCDWINLSICQLHGWVCLVAACLSPFIDRNRIGGRLPLVHVLHACAWNRDVRRTCVHRASTRACARCTSARALARCNRVHRLGAQIQRAELVHRTVEEAEDRIDSPVTETGDAQTERERNVRGAWLLAWSENPPQPLREKIKLPHNRPDYMSMMWQQDSQLLIFRNFSIEITIAEFDSIILRYVCWRSVQL